VIVGHIAQRLDLGLDRIEIGNRDPDMIEIADPVLLVPSRARAALGVKMAR
jgi:hypothetical protein